MTTMSCFANSTLDKETDCLIPQKSKEDEKPLKLWCEFVKYSTLPESIELIEGSTVTESLEFVESVVAEKRTEKTIDESSVVAEKRIVKTIDEPYDGNIIISIDDIMQNIDQEIYKFHFAQNKDYYFGNKFITQKYYNILIKEKLLMPQDIWDYEMIFDLEKSAIICSFNYMDMKQYEKSVFLDFFKTIFRRLTLSCEHILNILMNYGNDVEFLEYIIEKHDAIYRDFYKKENQTAYFNNMYKIYYAYYFTTDFAMILVKDLKKYNYYGSPYCINMLHNIYKNCHITFDVFYDRIINEHMKNKEDICDVTYLKLIRDHTSIMVFVKMYKTYGIDNTSILEKMFMVDYQLDKIEFARKLLKTIDSDRSVKSLS